MPTSLPSPNTTDPPVGKSAPSDQELDTYVRRKVIGALLSIVALLATVAVLSIRYREELGAVTTWIFDHVGLAGLVGLLFVSDALFSPVPPDAVLLLISKSSYHASWPTLIPALGLLSTVAGWLGYFCGLKVAPTSAATFLFRRFKQTSGAVIHRYGAWGVALGALTPMPFSVTCWTAGMLEIPPRRVLGPCLLRIPRFVVYYVAIAYAEALARFVF